MGGGGAMRAAAKVAGIGVVHAGIRGGVVSSSPAEQCVMNVSRPVSTILSSSGTNSDVATAVQRPAWELDDWELAGGVEDEFGMPDEPLPRVVFGAGGAPSLQEAKAATAELKDAINKVYLSGSSSSFGGVQQSLLPLSAKSDSFENKSCVTCDPEADVPKHAMMAFTLLNESPLAQSVVASLASDPNIWDAVLKNELLLQFLQSQTAISKVETEDLASTAKAAELSDDESEGEITDAETVLTESSNEAKQDGIFNTDPAELWNNVKQTVTDMARNVSAYNVKQTVTDMVHNASAYLQNIFAVPSAEKPAAEKEDDGSFGNFFAGKPLGASSFIGLAMLVIMVVIFKRV